MYILCTNKRHLLCDTSNPLRMLSELRRVHRLDAHRVALSATRHSPAEVARQAIRHYHAEQVPVLLDGERPGVRVQQQPQHIARGVRLRLHCAPCQS